MTASPVMPVLFGGLIAWGIYRRVRRNIGRQPLRPRRIIISIVIFSVVSILFLIMSLSQPRLLLGIGGGLLLGASLGFFGLRLTNLKRTPTAISTHPTRRSGSLYPPYLSGGFYIVFGCCGMP